MGPFVSRSNSYFCAIHPAFSQACFENYNDAPSPQLALTWNQKCFPLRKVSADLEQGKQCLRDCKAFYSAQDMPLCGFNGQALPGTRRVWQLMFFFVFTNSLFKIWLTVCRSQCEAFKSSCNQEHLDCSGNVKWLIINVSSNYVDHIRILINCPSHIAFPESGCTSGPLAEVNISK